MRFLSILVFTLSCVAGCTGALPPDVALSGISEDFLSTWQRVEHAHADIDHDGIHEWFLANPATRGNAGLSFLVLKRRGERWYPMGELFLNPRAFRVLPTASDGSIRLALYHRLSGSEGSIDTVTYRDGAFAVIDREVIHPGDGGTEAGRRRYAEVFSKDAPGHRLQWAGDSDEK